MCVAEDCTELCDADSLVPASHPAGKEMTPSGAVVPSSMTGRPTSGCWRSDDPTPKTDWVWHRCDYVDAQLCEMCHKEHPRFVHMMEHPVAGAKAVGKVCAAWMISPAPSGWPEEAQRQVVNRVARARARAKAYAKAKSLLSRWRRGKAAVEVLFEALGKIGSVVLRAERDADPELQKYKQLQKRINEGIKLAKAQRRASERAEKFAQASRLYAQWSAAGEPALWPILSQVNTLCHGAQQDGDPALADFEAFQCEVQATYDDFVAREHARRSAEEKMRRSVQWWREPRQWERAQSGSRQQFEFHHVRAWTFRRDDGRFSAAYEIGGSGVTWAPHRAAKATEAEAAALVEKSVGIKLVAQGFIHDAAE